MRMLVDDEREQVLAIDLLEKAKRQGLDLLPDVVERVAGVLAERPLDERFRGIQAPFAASQRRRVAVGELIDDRLGLIPRDIAELGDLDRDRLDLLGRKLAQHLRRLILRQAHQQHGRFSHTRHDLVRGEG